MKNGSQYLNWYFDTVSTDPFAIFTWRDLFEPTIPVKKMNWYVCGKCRTKLYREYKYCPECGKEIRWDDE